jgi:hypothetical protein
MSAQESYKEIQRMVETAKASWTIWFQLYAFDAGGHDYALVIQLHHPFFRAISVSCEHLTIMNLDELFKGRSDTHSFRTLIDTCVNEGRIDDRLAQACREKLESTKRIVKGIGILRGSYFGHKSRRQKPQEVFKRAGLKIKDVDELLDTAYWLLWKLAFPVLHDDPQIGQEDERYVKDSLKDVLQSLLDKFNSLGGAKIRIPSEP